MTHATIGTRLYLGAFPKSGLHMLRNMAYAIAQPASTRNWLSSFDDNCWTTRWTNLATIHQTIEKLPEGFFMRGHMGYNDDLARAFYQHGWAFVFLYRDLRDVAVSQLHHILSDDDTKFIHPGKALYRALGSEEAILLAIIEGLGPYAGLVERWELYEPWRRVPWVLKVRYEDLRQDPRGTASLLLRYVLARALAQRDMGAAISRADHDAIVEKMATLANNTALSPTFRRGAIGEWRQWFTPRTLAAFDATGGNTWLRRLGYEWGEVDNEYKLSPATIPG